MCGRFTRSRPLEEYAEYFQAAPTQASSPSYNVCPSDDILAVVAEPDQSRHLTWFHWGLVPFWSHGPDSRFSMINARAETLADKPAFRTTFRQHRCLVVADGFYEWQATGDGKQPFYIRLRSGEPMAMAGLWDQWEAKDGSQSISSATIITVTANALIRSIHDRMPVIVPLKNAQSWLDPGLTDTRKLTEYLKPIDADALEAWPVSPQVNSPTHQGADLIRPL
jgi:putative SOS response-associated peptidase YedK